MVKSPSRALRNSGFGVVPTQARPRSDVARNRSCGLWVGAATPVSLPHLYPSAYASLWRSRTLVWAGEARPNLPPQSEISSDVPNEVGHPVFQTRPIPSSTPRHQQSLLVSVKAHYLARHSGCAAEGRATIKLDGTRHPLVLRCSAEPITPRGYFIV